LTPSPGGLTVDGCWQGWAGIVFQFPASVTITHEAKTANKKIKRKKQEIATTAEQEIKS